MPVFAKRTQIQLMARKLKPHASRHAVALRSRTTSSLFRRRPKALSETIAAAGCISIRIAGGEAAAIAVAARVAIWKRATSLGSVESLIEHRASIEGEGSPVPADLLRPGGRRRPLGRSPASPRRESFKHAMTGVMIAFFDALHSSPAFILARKSGEGRSSITLQTLGRRRSRCAKKQQCPSATSPIFFPRNPQDTEINFYCTRKQPHG